VAENVTGQALDCGHFLPEEAPAKTLAQIERFLARHPLRAASARLGNI
jgi:haloacetate dehalogenase